MGREWQWGGSSAKASRSWRAFLGRERREDESEEKEGGRHGGLSNGCMRAVFRLLEFPHSFHLGYSSHHGSKSSNSFCKGDVRVRKGYEAPRNSLEVDYRASFRSNILEKESLEIRKRQASITIKTSIGDHKRAASYGGRPCPDPDNLNSPSCRTPNLVARLMGLDLLPHASSSSPSPISPLCHSGRNRPARRGASRLKSNGNYLERDSDIPGVRSLPETPRVSSGRTSDVEHHHRLSLQINKENMSLQEEIVLARVSAALRKKKGSLGESKENSGKCNSPGSYARQIVKQMKESVTRRAGQDITNTMNNKSSEFYDKPKLGKCSSAGNSPKLMNLDLEAKLARRSKVHIIKPATPTVSSDISLSSAKAPSRQKVRESEQMGTIVFSQETAKKVACKRMDKSIGRTAVDAIRSKHEEFFVKPAAGSAAKASKKSKTIPLSSTNLLPPTVMGSVKSPSIGKILKQEQNDSSRDLKSSPSLSRRISTSSSTDRDIKPFFCRCTTPASSVSEEKDYVARLLNHAGDSTDVHSLSLSRCSFGSYPVDHSAFYYLENFTDVATAYLGQLSQRWNRKLLFQLMNEILLGMMSPSVGPTSLLKPQMKDVDLVDLVCAKMRGFRGEDSRVVEELGGDIFPANGLDDGALEKLVIDLETHILERLVHETAVGLIAWRCN